MIELPEALCLAEQMREYLIGKKVVAVLPPTKPHKFCWFSGVPESYTEKLIGATVCGAEGFGIFAEISFDNGKKICINDGVGPRFLGPQDNSLDYKGDYQLKLDFEDGTSLLFTVGMYGGIYLNSGDFDNEYYLKSKQSVSPFSPEFKMYWEQLVTNSKDTISSKALLATEQRIPGLGNGVLQDILYEAGINPRTALKNLDNMQRDILSNKIVEVLTRMKEAGGRDTEKNLLGEPGGYQTVMSKTGIKRGCPRCGSDIKKENYMGGTVYYCPNCQPCL